MVLSAYYIYDFMKELSESIASAISPIPNPDPVKRGKAMGATFSCYGPSSCFTGILRKSRGEHDLDACTPESHGFGRRYHLPRLVAYLVYAPGDTR